MTVSKKKGKPITEREELLVCKHYIDGWPLKKIAAYASLSQTTVLAIMRRRNIPLRNGNRISVEQKKKVVELYVGGMSVANIISVTDICSEQTVNRIIKEEGVLMRRKRDGNISKLAQVREAILSRMEELNITPKACANDNGFDYGNFNKFLLGKRSFPNDKIEKILKYLELDFQLNC